MKLKFIHTVCCLGFVVMARAQNNLPVIRATSRYVDVRDGTHFSKKYWYILPEKNPDYYFVEIPTKEHRVTFTTDSDSISFDVKYGGEYDFIVLLNNKDSCRTRIVAKHKRNISFQNIRKSPAPDTIPFTVGDNSKIYFQGTINHSVPLNIQFDLGAGGDGCIIKKTSVGKVNMVFNRSVTLTNSDGTHAVPLSEGNTLQIANLTWDSTDFAVADNMTSREDLIVGNSLFQDKVVEINYDKKIIIIRDTLPPVDNSYTKLNMVLDGGVVPHVFGTYTIHGKTISGLFLFDTGAYTTILRTDEVSGVYKMFTEVKEMFHHARKETAAWSPQITIAGNSFRDFNYTVEKSGNDNAAIGLLGNDFLKRFNVLIDNRNGYIYLKQNSLMHERYSNPEYYVVRASAFVLVLLIAFIAFNRI